MGKSAILDLNMRLGEGTGAALALSILKGAIACHNNMALLIQRVYQVHEVGSAAYQRIKGFYTF